MDVHGQDSICACASATGGTVAVIRLSGPSLRGIAATCGLTLPPAWCWTAATLPLAAGRLPLRLLFAPAGRSYTGEDLLELVLPGSPVVVAAVLDHLRQAGAEPAGPGAFTRRAVAHGRMQLDQAEAVLALVQAGDAAAAGEALERLRGALGQELEPGRVDLLHLLATVEAGLDFGDEDDVRTWDPEALRSRLARVQARCQRWLRAAADLDGDPVVCLVGPPNAGKSALFRALGGGPALVSPQPGTTRDWLRADCRMAGRRLRLIDTAGFLDQASGVDAEAVARGQATLAGARLVLACSAPDARLTAAQRARLPAGSVVVATKADLGAIDPAAVLAVSAQDGSGLPALRGLISRHLDGGGGGDARQQELLTVAAGICADLLAGPLPEDVLLADDLRRAAEALGELVGATAPEAVLEQIFSRFCIGK